MFLWGPISPSGIHHNSEADLEEMPMGLVSSKITIVLILKKSRNSTALRLTILKTFGLTTKI